jgi:hypothetical protein
MSCDHELTKTTTGYGRSRRTHWKCEKCGEDDFSEILEEPEMTTVDPNELGGWEDNQDADKVASLKNAFENDEDVPPVVLNSNGTAIYDGHHRAEAGKQAGTEIPAVLIPAQWGGVASNMLTLQKALSAFDISH